MATFRMLQKSGKFLALLAILELLVRISELYFESIPGEEIIVNIFKKISLEHGDYRKRSPALRLPDAKHTE